MNSHTKLATLLGIAARARLRANAAPPPPLGNHPLLHRAVEQARAGGFSAAEGFLTEAHAADPADAAPLLGLGILWGQPGEMQDSRKAASWHWQALEQVVRRDGAEVLTPDVMYASNMLQASLISAPSCARTLCADDHTVDYCAMASPVPWPSALPPSSWPESVRPWRAILEGPASLVPLKGQPSGHVMLPSSDEFCWVFPAEHMSFTLFGATRSRRAQIRAREAAARKAGRVLTLPVRSCVGSVLHALGTQSFFHLAREGIASLLLLALQGGMPQPCGPEAVRGGPEGEGYMSEGYMSQVLVPDAPRWRAWAGALGLETDGGGGGGGEGAAGERDGSSSSTGRTPRLVYVKADTHVELRPGGRLAYIDWRRVAQPPAGGTAGGPSGGRRRRAYDTDMDYVSAYSAAAIGLVRAAASAMVRAAASTPATLAGGSGPAGGGDGLVRAAVGADGAASRAGRQPALPVPSIVYVSRNDSKTRRVHGEGSLLDALTAAGAPAYEGGPPRWDVTAVELSALPLVETARVISRAAAIVGPHGAGLFNAPLFADPHRASLVAFGLVAEHADKEENLLAACEAVGLRLIRPDGVEAPLMGDEGYRMGEPHVAAVVKAAEGAVAGYWRWWHAEAGGA